MHWLVRLHEAVSYCVMLMLRLQKPGACDKKVVWKIVETRMWANAQPDGRPAKHRWRPLSTPQSLADAHYQMLFSNAAKTRNPLKFAGVPQTNETISAASGPKFTIL